MSRTPLNRAKPKPEAEEAVHAPRNPTIECASRTIRIDHLQDKADSTVVPMFLDTKSVLQSVVTLFTYHGQPERLADEGVLLDLAETHTTSALALFGINEAISYVVIDNAYYEKLKGLPEAGDGSDLETCAVILDIAHQMRKAANVSGNDEFSLVVSLDES